MKKKLTNWFLSIDIFFEFSCSSMNSGVKMALAACNIASLTVSTNKMIDINLNLLP